MTSQPELTYFIVTQTLVIFWFILFTQLAGREELKVDKFIMYIKSDSFILLGYQRNIYVPKGVLNLPKPIDMSMPKPNLAYNRLNIQYIIISYACIKILQVPDWHLYMFL